MLLPGILPGINTNPCYFKATGFRTVYKNLQTVLRKICKQDSLPREAGFRMSTLTRCKVSSALPSVKTNLTTLHADT